MDFKIVDADRVYEVSGKQTIESVLDMVSKDLIASGYITSGYVDAIKDNLKRNGPYFVIAPNIAIPHAKAPEFITHPCISVVKCLEPVDVQGENVIVFIFLASKDSDHHMEILMKLSELLDSTEKQRSFINYSLEELKNAVKYLE